VDSVEILQLPAPGGQEGIFTTAVNVQSTSSVALLSQESKAMAVAFNEDVGLGALSKAGALILGEQGEWLQLAEEKMKKDNDMGYQELLWELGTEIVEKRHKENGGMNETHEALLLANLNEWFTKGGGKLHFSEPQFSKEGGYELVATEDVTMDDPVVTVPMKLIMCHQTARNILIYKKGKYLGDELQKTFDKNEVWGMTIFLLHEYYKEISGVGSKWGPFIRTLRMRALTTEAIHVSSPCNVIVSHPCPEYLSFMLVLAI